MKIGIIVLVGALVVGLIAPAFAQENEVVLSEYLLLRIRCASGGYSAEQRAEIIQKRANNLLELGKYSVDQIRVEQAGNEYAVYVGDQLLITADWCEARANRTTPKGLAEVWAARLHDILPLAMPKPAGHEAD